MKLVYSDHFKRNLSKRLIKHPQLKKRVSKQLKLLSQDARYPSLKTHKLSGKRVNEYSIWIADNIRIVFLISDLFGVL